MHVDGDPHNSQVLLRRNFTVNRIVASWASADRMSAIRAQVLYVSDHYACLWRPGPRTSDL